MALQSISIPPDRFLALVVAEYRLGTTGGRPWWFPLLLAGPTFQASSGFSRGCVVKSIGSSSKALEQKLFKFF